MKINAIRIKNLASLEGITEIDFTSEPLASAGIFAITGPTGAGKSTLLDALCLALYGKTPRYLQAKEMGIEIHDVQGSTMSQGDVRGILRDGTAEGFAEVEFIGTDGQNYCSTWSVRRSRNKADGSLQADTISLKNIFTNLDLPGKKAETYKEIERLVGLNFEQFTRSVLLAQGDFTAFMKASKDEKSSLLEKLTGTHIYSEISKKVFENYRSQEQILRELNIRRDGIIALSEEEFKEIQEQEIILKDQINQVTAEIESLSQEMKWHEQLVQFEKNKELANINLQKANENLAEAEIRKNKLFQVEQAQTTRSWNDALHYNQNQLIEKDAALLVLKTKIAELNLQKEQFEEQFKKDELNLLQVVKIQKEALPKLAEAKKLDTLISEKEKQKIAAKLEIELAKNKETTHLKLVSDKEIEITELVKNSSAIQDWQTKFEERKPIAENKDVIVSKLIDAGKLLGNLKVIGDEKTELNNQINKVSEELKTTSLSFENLEKDWLITQKKFEEHSKNVLLIPIEKINIEKDLTDLAINETVEILAFWKVFYSLKSNYKSLENKNVANQLNLVDIELKLQKSELQFSSAKTAKETSETLLQKARLVATENVQSLRESLVNDEPCPVCGSENHPYALHNPQVDLVLESLENEHLKNNELYLNLIQEIAKIKEEQRGLKKQVQKENTELISQKEALKSKEIEWSKKFVFAEIESIDDEQISNWIDAKILKLKTTQVDLQFQIKAYSDQRNQIDTTKTQLEILKGTIDKSANEIKDFTSKISIYKEKITGIEKEISQKKESISEIKNAVSTYFKASDWMEKWEIDPIAFVNHIITFSQEWKLKSEKLERHKNEEIVASSEIKQMQNQAKILAEEVSLKTNNYNLQESDFLALKVERNTIFEGQSAELMERKFKDTVEEVQKNLEITKVNLNQNKVEIGSTEAQFKEVKITVYKLNLEVENATAKIEKWLKEYAIKFGKSFSILELNELLNFNSEWIENERKLLNELVVEHTKATSIFLERTQIFDEHLAKRHSERILDDIKILFENAKKLNENLGQAKANIGFKLKEDEVNKEKIGTLLVEISAQCKITDNWSKLSEVIGSADGKKFRQIAQEHTLEVLLSFANLHLKDLTIRYKIERIPNTLGLQVVDLDMGDEIRTVYSLSGGESFLVSLALALGLASLSSSKMKVESLFIDEGFGSLDPNTLNIAMDALERLHNQGRKVGVISHVQEMTERIPVQIKVSKKASGRSKVEILGI